MRRLALYAFVITLLWLGFVCAISFVEAPLKFRALGIKEVTEATPAVRHALTIGSAVFHALNRIEWIACVFSVLIMARLRFVRTRGSVILLTAITLILAFQTWGLYPLLDYRTAEFLRGNPSPATWHHQAFVVAEVIKALLLGMLAAVQIQTFARAVISE